MGYPARLLTDDEVVLRDFHPHWKMLVPSVLVLAGMAALLVFVLGLPPYSSTTRQVGAAVVVAVGGAFVTVTLLRWWFTQYVLTTERLIVRQGVVARSGLEIPLEQINNVSFSQGIGERLLRFGDLVIESAGSTGRSKIDNIPDPQGFQSEVYAARDARISARDGGGISVVEQLERLEGLRDRGAITDDEYQVKKRGLLGSA